jgi:hypothetical protein
MKKTNLFSLVASLLLLVLSSCSKSGGSGSGTGTCSWSCDINGVHYSWSGTYPASFNDQAIFVQQDGGPATITLFKDGNLNSTSLQVLFEPNPTPGTHNFNSSNSSATRGVAAMLAGSGEVYSSIVDGSNFNITIPSIPTNSYASAGGAAGAGYFKGTFSGTLMDFSSNSINITNGKFEVIVVQND